MIHNRRGVCDWQYCATVYLGCRLSRQSYPGVIHYSLLLMLFGAAAFKAVHTPLLTTMLVSELASMLGLAGKMQAIPFCPTSLFLASLGTITFCKAAVQSETYVVGVRQQTSYS